MKGKARKGSNKKRRGELKGVRVRQNDDADERILL